MTSFRRVFSWRQLIAAILLCSCLNSAAAQIADDPDLWLPLTDVRFTENGDLASWQVTGLGAGSSELIESGRRLLSLTVLADDKDVSTQISWRRLAPRDGHKAEFSGTHENLALEIRRSYRPGVNPATIIHELETVGQGTTSGIDIRLLLQMPPSLRKHALNDGSLGDVFYGHRGVFSAESSAAEFTPVREPSQAATAAISTRHVAVVLSAEPQRDDGFAVSAENGVTLTLDDGQSESINRQTLGAVKLNGSVMGYGRFGGILYADTWSPLRQLALLIERALYALNAVLNNTGVAVIAFAVILRMLLLPLGLWCMRQQRQYATVQQQMKPALDKINETLKGAEKSERILETYKEHGISPFSGLKGSAGLLIQLPLLIAFFAVTTESALFRDAVFLWVPDLSLPDRALELSFSIPGLGGFVNLLPILLGLISVVAALILAHTNAGTSPRSGLILALVFVVLFYSCAAALVLYWIVVNVAQIFEGLYLARSTSERA